MGDDNKAGFGPADDNEEVTTESELDTLKSRADQMGIKYHPNIGLDKLKAKIKERLTGDSSDDGEEEDVSVSKGSPVTRKESANEKRARSLKDAGRLVRIRVTCMNPMKSEWEGEIFTAGNSEVGNFKKYVPFDVDWHVPQIILNMMEERKYQSFYTVTDKRTGQKGRKGKLVSEFSIQKLPPLTKEELQSLAQRQAMAKGTAEA